MLAAALTALIVPLQLAASRSAPGVPAVPRPMAEFDGLGHVVAPLGDVDGDDVPDFQVGSSLNVVSGRALKSVARLGLFAFGGSDWVGPAGDVNGDGFGDVLYQSLVLDGRLLVAGTEERFPIRQLVLHGLDSPAGVAFGGQGRQVGDLNGDGVPEIVGGWADAWISRCPGDSILVILGGSPGFASVYDGRDGSVLATVSGETTADAFGGLVQPLDDLDGDGVLDFAVGTRIIPYSEGLFCHLPEGNYVRTFSGATGQPLWTLEGAPRSMAALQDMDGDGTPDVVLGYAYESRIELVSGVDGRRIASFDDRFLPNDLHLLGNQVYPWQDLDGDGREDLLVSIPQPVRFSIGVPGGPQSAGPGIVAVLSSQNGKPLARLRGSEDGQEFGAQLAVLGDIDGDGVPEIGVGSSGVEGGLVQIFSGADLH